MTFLEFYIIHTFFYKLEILERLSEVIWIIWTRIILEEEGKNYW